MDPVLDLASTAEHLWVATPGGLLRYSLEGGTPLRVAGTAGPGGTRMVAVGGPGRSSIWALGEGGLARYDGSAWARRAGKVPDVGPLTALAVESDHRILVGGTKGLVLFDNGDWASYSRSVHVTAFALPPSPVDQGAWVGTKANGLWHLGAKGTVSEHRPDRGLPCGPGPIRAVAATSEETWALCRDQDGTGSILARLDGERRWLGLSATLPGTPTDLSRCGDRVILLTDRGLWRVAQASQQDDETTADQVVLEVAARAPARAKQYRASPGLVRDGPELAKIEPRPKALPFTAARAETLAKSVLKGSEPRFVLRPVPVTALPRATTLGCDARGIWVGTEGLGALQAAGRGREQVFRTLDLVVENRPFSVTADDRGRAWFLSRDLSPGVLDESFEHAQVETDETAGIEPLAFAEGYAGTTSFALGRLRESDWIYVYQLDEDSWRQLLRRELSTAQAEPWEVDFFEVDPAGRFWIGLVIPGEAGARRLGRGIAVLDRETEEVTYHGDQPRGPGGKQVANDVSAVGFSRAGDAWLGSLSGAVLLRADGSRQDYTEANGLLGGIVSDLAVRDDIPWVATPAGLGRFEGGIWRFFLDDQPRDLHVTSLTIDSRGELWAGGNRGAVHFDGNEWETITRSQGLISDRVQSVHVDSRDRVWFVTDAGISILTRP